LLLRVVLVVGVWLKPGSQYYSVTLATGSHTLFNVLDTGLEYSSVSVSVSVSVKPIMTFGCNTIDDIIVSTN